MSTSDDPWPAEATSRQVDLDGPVHFLDFQASADAPVMVCLHGLGGSALNFGLLGPRLALDYRVVALDLLGHGDTRPSPPGGIPAVQLEWQLRLIDRFLQQISDRPVVLIGHSLGGILALKHALRYPETIDRLILLAAPVPSRTRLAFDPRLMAKRAFLSTPGVHAAVSRKMAKLTPEQLVQRQLQQATPHAADIALDSISATVRQTTRRANQADAASSERTQWSAILAVMDIIAHPASWRRQLDRLETPTLWLQGEDDLLVNPAGAAALAATQSNWDFRSRAGSGHLLHLEDPAWTADTISRWLGKEGRAGIVAGSGDESDRNI